MPLTKLGKALGDMHATVEIPEDIELLEIPAGRIEVQRLFTGTSSRCITETTMTSRSSIHRLRLVRTAKRASAVAERGALAGA